MFFRVSVKTKVRNASRLKSFPSSRMTKKKFNDNALIGFENTLWYNVWITASITS